MSRLETDHPTASQIVDLYHRMFCDSQESYKMSWLGIPTIQNPNDIWIIQELISRLKPNFIVETGTWLGGSAIIYAMIQDQVNPRGRIITIDKGDSVDRKNLPSIAGKVDFLVGDSLDPVILYEVGRRVTGSRVMVMLDSDHRKDHVLKEMYAYSSLVSVDSYMIVQDTNVNGHPVLPDFGPGPMEAVEEFLKNRDDFEVDHHQERLLFTMHANGFLRRVRSC